MTATALPTGTPLAHSDPGRGNVRASGIFYLLTFASSIPAYLMLAPILDDPRYILGPGQDTQIVWACFLDVVNALTAIGTAVAVYPIVKRVNRSMALGFVMSRMTEAAVIMTGIIALLTVVVLRQTIGGPGASNPETLTTVGQALVITRDWTFLFGPGFMACVNAVLFGTLLYRSRFVPRLIPTLGLIGAPLLLTANVLTFFGHNTQDSGWTMLATAPIAVWELSVGFWMTFKGFRQS